MSDIEHRTWQTKIGRASAHVKELVSKMQHEKNESKLQGMLHEIQGASELRDSLMRQYTQASAG